MPASLKEHATVDHEVVVIDDGSHDGTAAAVEVRFPAAEVVALPANGGLPAGRNAALPPTVAPLSAPSCAGIRSTSYHSCSTC